MRFHNHGADGGSDQPPEGASSGASPENDRQVAPGEPSGVAPGDAGSLDADSPTGPVVPDEVKGNAGWPTDASDDAGEPNAPEPEGAGWPSDAAGPPPPPWLTPPPSGDAPTWSPPWAAPSAGPGGWPAPTPPPPPAWPPSPTQQSSQGGQPGSAWPPVPAAQPGSTWPPVPAGPAYGTGAWPPPGYTRRSHPSRAPQVLVVVAACLIAFSGGLITDHIGFASQAPGTTAPGGNLAATPFGTIQGGDLYDQALQIVKQYWVGRADLTDQQLLYGSIKGMVDSLGDTGHSTFLTPQEYAAMQASLNASFAGIGVSLSNANGLFVVDRVIPNSPAEAAGVKAGDQIIAVDGVNTAGMTLSDFTNKIRGPAGTKVTITVLHTGSATPVDITMTRANVTVPLADWGMVPGTHVADIVLNEFASGAADQLQTDITAATDAGATSLILDLRGNPGGYADEAQEVASEFLSSGTVYILQDANGHNTSVEVDTKRAHTNLPLVVLVDHDSASSAEIVAGALQDNGRAKIVGVNTFGTGTVLQEFKLSDGSVIILGTAWWLTPNGHRIFGVGIKPDQEVELSTGAVPVYPTDLTSMSAYQYASSGDAQLIAGVNDLNH
jgi:carboxyl-terminal processing protease